MVRISIQFLFFLLLCAGLIIKGWQLNSLSSQLSAELRETIEKTDAMQLSDDQLHRLLEYEVRKARDEQQRKYLEFVQRKAEELRFSEFDFAVDTSEQAFLARLAPVCRLASREKFKLAVPADRKINVVMINRNSDGEEVKKSQLPPGECLLSIVRETEVQNQRVRKIKVVLGADSEILSWEHNENFMRFTYDQSPPAHEMELSSRSFEVVSDLVKVPKNGEPVFLVSTNYWIVNLQSTELFTIAIVDATEK